LHFQIHTALPPGFQVLKPRHFLKLDDELLRRYAAAFEISVELLKDYKGEKEKDEENG